MIKKSMLVLIFISLLYPLWILIAYSFSRDIEYLMFPLPLFPKNASVASYVYIFKSNYIGQWIFNTVVLVGLSTILSPLISAITGYVFAQYEFKGKRVLWALILFGVMVPRISLIIPLFVITAKMHISGTLWACLFPALLSPIGIYLARNYFTTIPKSIIEAARIDGAGDIGILAHVVIPLCGPIMAALALFAALGAMNDWIWQALQLQDDSVQTILVGFMRIATRRGALIFNSMGRQMAVGVVLLFPMIIMFIFANKYFVGGFSNAIKE